jgi:acylphosphatase
MISRAHVFVSGIVQGVFFRASTRDEARMLGLKGWVRNLPDGRVEAVFEGEKSAVGQMLLWCAHGPPSAEVTDLETRWEDASSEFKSFDII